MVVLFIISALFIVHQSCEHIAAAHMVAVDQRVAVRKVRSVAVIHENAAVGIHRAVYLVIQIIFIVPMLQHGIVDNRVRQIDPCYSIRVLLLELLKIHSKVLFSLSRLADGVLISNILVEICALLLFRIVAVDLIGGKQKNDQQNKQSRIIQSSFQGFLFHRAYPLWDKYIRFSAAWQDAIKMSNSLYSGVLLR